MDMSGGRGVGSGCGAGDTGPPRPRGRRLALGRSAGLPRPRATGKRVPACVSQQNGVRATRAAKTVTGGTAAAVASVLPPGLAEQAVGGRGEEGLGAGRGARLLAPPQIGRLGATTPDRSKSGEAPWVGFEEPPSALLGRPEP